MLNQRIAPWFEKDALPKWALIVVALAELLLCLDYHDRRWSNEVAARNLRAEQAGEGLVIQWNGLGYYAWLRSLLIDHDWDFDNEFDEHNLYRHYVPPRQYRTPLDRRANQWSVGPACIWAVTVVPGHCLIKAMHGSLLPWQPDGYSLPYQLLVGATSLLAAFAGLGFIYGLCRTQARPARAALAAALLTLGTTIVYFSAIEISLPHGIGTAVLAGMVWYWLITYGCLRPRRWFVVGLLLGAAVLMRWQLATFAVLPAAEAVLAIWRRRDALAPAVMSAAGAALAFLPQMIAWRCVYGAWLVNPMQGVCYHWLSPSFWEILLSQDRSLFYWTPLTLMAWAGTLARLIQGSSPPETEAAGLRTLPKEPVGILTIAFVVQLYALAGMWGQGELMPTIGNYGGVFLARSYGFRDLTESLVVLAPGLAWLLEQAPPWRFRVLAGVGLLLVIWNLLLVSLYTNDLIPALAGAEPSTLLTQAGELIRHDPFSLLQAAEGPALIAVLLVFASRPTQYADREPPG